MTATRRVSFVTYVSLRLDGLHAMSLGLPPGVVYVGRRVAAQSPDEMLPQ